MSQQSHTDMSKPNLETFSASGGYKFHEFVCFIGVIAPFLSKIKFFKHFSTQMIGLKLQSNVYFNMFDG